MAKSACAAIEWSLAKVQVARDEALSQATFLESKCNRSIAVVVEDVDARLDQMLLKKKALLIELVE